MKKLIWLCIVGVGLISPLTGIDLTRIINQAPGKFELFYNDLRKDEDKLKQFLSKIANRKDRFDIFNNLVQRPGGRQIARDLYKFDKRTSNGLFFTAIKKNNFPLVAVLADAGNYIDVANRHYKTPLRKAIDKGYTDIAIFLIEKGANVNARDQSAGESPLFAAVRKGNADVVALLLDNGAEINAKNIQGEKPLIIAIQENQPAIVDLLIRYNANPKEIYKSISALSWARSLGNKAIVDILQKAISGK